MRARIVVWLAIAGSGSVAGGAAGAPNADVVIAWSPQPLGRLGEVVADAARRSGAAFVDVSAAATPAPDVRPLVRRGVDAYGALDFDAALVAFDAAVDLVDRTGGANLDTAALSDLFLHRGLTRIELGDAGAWDDFVAAATIAPSRIVDPGRFSPRAVEPYTRARAQVAAGQRATVRLVGNRGCDVRFDGSAVAGDLSDVPFGRHWLAAECIGRQPVRRTVDVDRPAIDVAVAGAAIAPPADDELVIQGRTIGARAIAIVTLRGDVVIARLVGLDGRERDRASAAIDGDVAAAIVRLLEPRSATPARRRWYESRWVWVMGGVVVASAILIPIAASDRGTSATIQLGVPGW